MWNPGRRKFFQKNFLSLSAQAVPCRALATVTTTWKTRCQIGGIEIEEKIVRVVEIGKWGWTRDWGSMQEEDGEERKGVSADRWRWRVSEFPCRAISSESMGTSFEPIGEAFAQVFLEKKKPGPDSIGGAAQDQGAI